MTPDPGGVSQHKCEDDRPTVLSRGRFSQRSAACDLVCVTPYPIRRLSSQPADQAEARRLRDGEVVEHEDFTPAVERRVRSPTLSRPIPILGDYFVTRIAEGVATLAAALAPEPV